MRGVAASRCALFPGTVFALVSVTDTNSYAHASGCRRKNPVGLSLAYRRHFPSVACFLISKGGAQSPTARAVEKYIINEHANAEVETAVVRSFYTELPEFTPPPWRPLAIAGQARQSARFWPWAGVRFPRGAKKWAGTK